jgi:hypothetical protein
MTMGIVNPEMLSIYDEIPKDFWNMLKMWFWTDAMMLQNVLFFCKNGEVSTEKRFKNGVQEQSRKDWLILW